MSPNVLLALMLASYAVPIVFVYYKYATAAAAAAANDSSACRSISSIITSTEPFCLFTATTTATTTAPPPRTFVFQTRYFIALCMLTMAGFTVLYEIQRPGQSGRWSLATIIFLLCGIFGVIFVPEQNPTHYLFAAAAFFSIIGFMVGHTFYGNSGSVAENLRILLYAQFLFMVITVCGVIQDAPIFIVETLFLLNFAVFYLYLHYTTVSCPVSDPDPESIRAVSFSSSSPPLLPTPLVIR